MSTHMGAGVLAAGIRPRRGNPLTSCFAKNEDATTGQMGGHDADN